MRKRNPCRSCSHFYRNRCYHHGLSVADIPQEMRPCKDYKDLVEQQWKGVEEHLREVAVKFTEEQKQKNKKEVGNGNRL